MELQKHKLVATASCEGAGACRGRMIDRLSNLPDHVGHLILSFLSMPDLARLSYASKFCRELCLSSPVLNFSQVDCMPAADKCDRQQRLLNSLERFFLLRGDNTIQSFHFDWRAHSENQKNQSSSSSCVCRDVYFRVMSCVQKAVRCNVEELNLGLLELGKPIQNFPSFLFLCGSLKSLTVHMIGILKTPSFSVSSNLKYLELCAVVIADEGFFKWISCSCKCIRNLRLLYPVGMKNLNIESSSLEMFTLCRPQQDLDTLHISVENLQQLRISFRTGSPTITSLNIFAPNLKQLRWTGNLMSRPNLRKFQSLKYAKVKFDSVGTVCLGENIQDIKYTSIVLVPTVDDFDPLCEVFRSLRINEVLTLNEVVIKIMFKLEGSMPVSFENVRALRINIGCIIDDIVPPMVSLLRQMPYLRALGIRHCPPLHDTTSSNKYGFDMGYWKLQNLAFINQLEHFTTELLDEFNEVEFARYLLECAPKLKTVLIICSPLNLEDVQRMLAKCKMISRAAIFLKERREKRTKTTL